MAWEIMKVKDWDYSGGLVVGPGYIQTGGVVRAVQELMLCMGHSPGAFDGEYGPNTESAIKAYQASVGLTQDGIVGPATWAELWKNVRLNSNNPVYWRGLEYDDYTFYGVYDNVTKKQRTESFEQCIDSGNCLYWWGYYNENTQQMEPMDNSLTDNPSEFTDFVYIADSGS